MKPFFRDDFSGDSVPPNAWMVTDTEHGKCQMAPGKTAAWSGFLLFYRCGHSIGFDVEAALDGRKEFRGSFQQAVCPICGYSTFNPADHGTFKVSE